MNNIQQNYPLKYLTTLGIGGPAKEFVTVTTEDELIEVIKNAKSQNQEFLVIGGGSNLLVSDEGLDKLVIKNEIKGIKKNGDTITVKSGTTLQDLVEFTIENSLSGIHKLTGIPGTVGGAIYGKIAAYGHDISDYLTEVKAFDGQNIITLSKEECDFGYRDSGFKKTKYTILEATFKNLPSQDKESLIKEQDQVMEKRVLLYPPDTKCPGSFFKNIEIKNAPENIMEILQQNLPPEVFKRVKSNVENYRKIPIGALLESIGAKGDHLGQIEISQTHANTFINKGNGTAKDFYTLAKKYSDKIKEKFHITPEPEVQLINLPSLN